MAVPRLDLLTVALATTTTPLFMSSTTAQPRKRVAIVGAGAAGMSAAYALSLKPDLFDVTLFERSTYTGGMATSTEIDEATYGASYINDGVQG